VVLGSVPDYGLVVVNPARQIGWMCACATKLPFEMSSTHEIRCVCENCGRSFVAIENKSGMVEVKEA